MDITPVMVFLVNSYYSGTFTCKDSYLLKLANMVDNIFHSFHKLNYFCRLIHISHLAQYYLLDMERARIMLGAELGATLL